MSSSLWPHRLWPAGLPYPWHSPVKNTRVGSHSLPQRIFLIQGSNLGLLHCRQILYHLSHWGPISGKVTHDCWQWYINGRIWWYNLVKFSSVTQSCPTLCDPMDCSTPGLPVHQLPEFTQTHVMEKAMATHSSVLDWRIPGMGEPGGLPFMGSHRVRHDWSDLPAAAAASVKYTLDFENLV